ncbi:peroxiredoxin family protein [bacterium]|nr:peroxiredoxin family protein [bacterium]
MLFFLFVFLLLPSSSMALIYGQRGPDFTLDDLDGNEHSLSDYEGKVVFLFFFGYS